MIFLRKPHYQQSHGEFEYQYLPGSDLVSAKTATIGTTNSTFSTFNSTFSYEPYRDLIAVVSNTFASSSNPIFHFPLSIFHYGHDAAGRRVGISRSGAAFGARDGGEVRGFDYDYSYDPIGNRTSATEYDEQGSAWTSTYTANSLNQYTQRTVPGTAQVRGEADADAEVLVNGYDTWRNGEYFYGGDSADNSASPVFKDLTIEAYRAVGDDIDEVNAVTGRVFVAQSPEQFTYDADGNMLTDGCFRYTWNAENRMVMAEELYAPTNREPYVITYAYDHKGRMVRKDVALASNPSFSILHSTFVWDGWNIIRETATDLSTSQPFNLSTDYVWGLDIDGSLQGAGGVGGLLAVVRDDGTYLPTYDANGNVSEYINAEDGSIVAHYDYSPFGELLMQDGDQAGTFTHRFSTKPYCPITKLVEYQMRKYRPEIGRWLSRDPIEELENLEINKFSFCSNNCLYIFDILGLSIDKSEFHNYGAVPHNVFEQLYEKEQEYEPDDNTRGFTKAVVTYSTSVEQCGRGDCYKVMIDKDVTITGSMAWKLFLDSYDPITHLPVYNKRLSYKGRSGRAVGNHEKEHLRHAEYHASEVDKMLHKLADGSCTTHKCAVAKNDFLHKYARYIFSVRDHDDAELDYEDYPLEYLDEMRQKIIAAVISMHARSAEMEIARNAMEQACEQ